MTTCAICGEALQPEQKVCDTCGTSVPTSGAPAITEALMTAASHAPPTLPRPVLPAPVPAANSSVPARCCPLCHARYPADYRDEFCRCGGELVAVASASQTQESPRSIEPVSNPGPLSPTPVTAPPQTPVVPDPIGPAKPVRPAPGTVCLVVYSEQKEPIHYCVIAKDVTLVGRSDPVRGDFPDLDLSELFDTSISKRISRKHVMILRSRTTGTYSLRPLGGNTGTQVEKELATQLQDYPLTSGTRLVLGGVVRLKFEVL
ncbi:MAG: hypothetical protein JWM11_3473 [Planctomycetaceae bacterium]|nr:hypothetical protein [Planctomycetaceae bacterium]